MCGIGFFSKFMKKFFILVLGIFALLGCSSQDNWTAFYYPNENDLEYFTKQSGFIDREACSDYLLNLLDSLGDEYKTSSHVECGKNCELNIELRKFVCDEKFE